MQNAVLFYIFKITNSKSFQHFSNEMPYYNQQTINKLDVRSATLQRGFRRKALSDFYTFSIIITHLILFFSALKHTLTKIIEYFGACDVCCIFVDYFFVALINKNVPPGIPS